MGENDQQNEKKQQCFPSGLSSCTANRANRLTVAHSSDDAWWFDFPAVQPLHHLAADQVVQQLPGVLLHPDGEVRPAGHQRGRDRRGGAGGGPRVRALPGAQHALQQGQRLRGKTRERDLKDVFDNLIFFKNGTCECLSGLQRTHVV